MNTAILPLLLILIFFIVHILAKPLQKYKYLFILPLSGVIFFTISSILSNDISVYTILLLFFFLLMTVRYLMTGGIIKESKILKWLP